MRVRRKAAPEAALFVEHAEERASERTPLGVRAGIDEAGLGPVLGPLTIAVTAFRVPPDVRCAWSALADVVARATDDAGERLVVDDSKRVFDRTPRGERRLERTALAFLAQRARARGVPATARELVRSFEHELCAADDVEREFWARELDVALPRHAERDELGARAENVRTALANAGIELLDAAVRVVPVPALNASFAATDNKARTHWLETRVLVTHLWRRHAADGLELVVDRHGGRMRYQHVLAETFPDARVAIVRETAPLSEYTVEQVATPHAPARRMRVVFREQAEQSSFAVALASCLAKYLREVCMGAFNAHFRALAPELAPTAGYHTDATRWLADARPVLERTRIAERELVRAR